METPLVSWQVTAVLQHSDDFGAAFSEQQLAPLAICLVGPQQSLASSQQAFPSVQHFWTAAQHPLFSAQHFSPFSQQPSLASAAQQALFSLQHASLAEQQSFGLSTAPESRVPRTTNEPVNSFANMEISPVDDVWKIDDPRADVERWNRSQQAERHGFAGGRTRVPNQQRHTQKRICRFGPVHTGATSTIRVRVFPTVAETCRITENANASTSV